MYLLLITQKWHKKNPPLRQQERKITGFLPNKNPAPVINTGISL